MVHYDKATIGKAIQDPQSTMSDDKLSLKAERKLGDHRGHLLIIHCFGYKVTWEYSIYGFTLYLL